MPGGMLSLVLLSTTWQCLSQLTYCYSLDANANKRQLSRTFDHFRASNAGSACIWVVLTPGLFSAAEGVARLQLEISRPLVHHGGCVVASVRFQTCPIRIHLKQRQAVMGQMDLQNSSSMPMSASYPWYRQSQALLGPLTGAGKGCLWLSVAQACDTKPGLASSGTVLHTDKASRKEALDRRPATSHGTRGACIK